MPATLSIHNLVIGYRNRKQEVRIAGPLNATMQAGELICIMGANGVGKSTFLKTISGILAPISGELLVAGKNLLEISNIVRARLVSVVLTGRPNTDYMSIRDLVILGRYPYTNWQNSLGTEDTEAVDEALEAVGLLEEADNLVAELSDGNAQKAMIARMLAQQTPIVVLDEPLVHLDTRNKKIILELLVSLARQLDKTVIVSSHDLAMMKQVADKIWLFDTDNLITGTPEDLILSGELDRVLGTESVEISATKASQFKIKVEGSTERAGQLIVALKRAGYILDEDARVVIREITDRYEVKDGHQFTTTSTIEATLDFLKGIE